MTDNELMLIEETLKKLIFFKKNLGIHKDCICDEKLVKKLTKMETKIDKLYTDFYKLLQGGI